MIIIVNPRRRRHDDDDLECFNANANEEKLITISGRSYDNSEERYRFVGHLERSSFEQTRLSQIFGFPIKKCTLYPVIRTKSVLYHLYFIARLIPQGIYFNKRAIKQFVVRYHYVATSMRIRLMCEFN